jgi:hypothetical protein
MMWWGILKRSWLTSISSVISFVQRIKIAWIELCKSLSPKYTKMYRNKIHESCGLLNLQRCLFDSKLVPWTVSLFFSWSVSWIST